MLQVSTRECAIASFESKESYLVARQHHLLEERSGAKARTGVGATTTEPEIWWRRREVCKVTYEPVRSVDLSCSNTRVEIHDRSLLSYNTSNLVNHAQSQWKKVDPPAKHLSKITQGYFFHCPTSSYRKSRPP